MSKNFCQQTFPTSTERSKSASCPRRTRSGPRSRCHPLGLPRLVLVAPELVRPTLIVAAGCPIFVPAGPSPGRFRRLYTLTFSRVPRAPESHSAPNDTPTFDLRSRAEVGRGRHRHTAERAGTTSGHGPRDLGAHLAVPPKPHPATCNGPFVEVAPPPAWRGRDQLKTGKMSSLS